MSIFLFGTGFRLQAFYHLIQACLNTKGLKFPGMTLEIKPRPKLSLKQARPLTGLANDTPYVEDFLPHISSIYRIPYFQIFTNTPLSFFYHNKDTRCTYGVSACGRGLV